MSTSKNEFTDFQLVIASVNGSGTLTSNRILHKCLFKEGYHVIGKNLFPSNIEGLPTYYFLRISKGYNSLKKKNDLYVALNPATYFRDLKTIADEDTTLLFNSDLKITPAEKNPHYALSFKKTVATSKTPIKIKKRMSNMSYVGWIVKHLNLDLDNIKNVIKNQFENVLVAEENIQVMLQGWEAYDASPINLKESFVESQSVSKEKGLKKQILIEGNQASALGWVEGGCTVATWYPITPSTSLVESFETYAKSLRPHKNSTAVLQSEDEISAIASVVGAGWAGARAATATSGPGLSLMTEALGLAYFAEIPSVVCDVQRMGPSTGLPTRTSQGDLEFAYKISHGDTFHPVLLPSNPKECYEMSAQAFDLADKYQTPVFVLSDLDLGMNLWTSEVLAPTEKPFERSRILNELDLEKLSSEGQKFKRYLGDEFGIPKRTLPGTHHNDAAYFTRGSGHNESGGYTEQPEDYERLMKRLSLKILSARQDLPGPIIDITDSESQLKIGVIYYGSTKQIFPELNSLLNIELNVCQVRSLPLHQEVFDFIESQDLIFVIEQNRDGQLKNIILQNENLTSPQKIKSITQFDGWSIQADQVAQKIQNHLTVTRPSNAVDGVLK